MDNKQKMAIAGSGLVAASIGIGVVGCALIAPAGRGFAQRRDAAIIAVFRATGIRLAELAGLRYSSGQRQAGEVDLKNWCPAADRRGWIRSALRRVR